ncbi:MAG: hypothetical protein P8X48_02025 [Acidiferrobacteraceae bacterium]|jgi:hypothetical protein
MARGNTNIYRWMDDALTPRNFPRFYRLVSSLRFPIEVSDVLELRAVLNDAVDHAPEPVLTPDYRDFREALYSAVDSFGLESKRHAERLLAILVMLRGLHYRHSIISRDAENALRIQQEEVRIARRRSLNYGVAAMTLVGGLAAYWFVQKQPGWAVEAATLIASYGSLDQFRSLPLLDRERRRINTEINDVLRERVSSMDWKMLIHKLSLLMGYKRVSGVAVFHGEHIGTSGILH